MPRPAAGRSRGTSPALRYGGPLGSDTQFRVYGKYFDRSDEVLSDGSSSASDSWRQARGAFASIRTPPRATG